ncbi:hypothetical protein J3R82DRAFT_10146 [Butyriboletus roseoflavus]|nr:hypothetical protein J3R82DRAFT_10146 [Butyriboletus roseoflavus]
MSVPSLPNYLDPLPAQSPYDFFYTNQPRLYQADETTPVALPAPGPPGLPYSSVTLTTRYPRSLPEPTNDLLSATSAFDQVQIQASNHPLSTSTTFHESGRIAPALSAPPIPPATANPAADHSNTVHHCQCVTGGSPCNGMVQGTIRSIRDHLNRTHRLRGPGKDMVDCLWVGCERRLQRENIPRHIVTRHLRVKVSCVNCGLRLSRRDVQYSHAKTCRAGRRTASRPDSNPSSANAR